VQRPRRFRAVATLIALAGALPMWLRHADAAAVAQGPPDGRPPGGTAVELARDGPFDPDTVVRLARALARAPFVAATGRLPASLTELDYDQYRDIRVRPDATIWSEPRHTFRLEPLPLGYLFVSPVEIAIVKGGAAQHTLQGAHQVVMTDEEQIASSLVVAGPGAAGVPHSATTPTAVSG
jgi:glucan biosynthesis protein